METENFVLFFGHKPNKSNLHIFSQWFPCYFVENYDCNIFIEYNSTEQYMMAHKAILFGDAESFGKIIECDDPSQIKKLGRGVKNFDSVIWNNHKFGIALNGNILKFSQNKKLKKRLLNTGSKLIAEASPYDNIWGIGINAKTALTMQQKDWPGENLLGKVLMTVRKDLR